MKVNVVGLSGFVSKKGDEFYRVDCISNYNKDKGLGVQCFNVITPGNDPRIPGWKKGITSECPLTVEIFFVGNSWRMPSAD